MWITEKGKEIEFRSLVEPSRTALLVIDVQNDFCHQDGAFGRAGHPTSGMSEMATSLRELLGGARERQLLIIFVRATYDREVTSAPLAQHRRRLGLLDSLCLEGSWGADWYGGIKPSGAVNEVVVTKHRFDAFQGTPLDLYLRSNGIRTVIITGVVTSGCVESTVRHAFFKDYHVVVPRDAVHESSKERHETGLEVMTRSFATVTHVNTIIDAWRSSNAPPEPAWTSRVRARRAAENARPSLVLLDMIADAPDSAAAASIQRLLETARDLNIAIIHVRSIDEPVGRDEWKCCDGAKAVPAWHRLSVPRDGEMIVEKMRRSAFADTRLSLLLRANCLGQVVVGGTSAKGSLEATCLAALDADFAVTAVSDAVSVREAELADGWRSTLEAAGATVASVDEVIEQWRRTVTPSTRCNS
jgi:ureidoacrylate peracid hydrolase